MILVIWLTSFNDINTPNCIVTCLITLYCFSSVDRKGCGSSRQPIKYGAVGEN